jgi:hypothetical protein
MRAPVAEKADAPASSAATRPAVADGSSASSQIFQDGLTGDRR